ncbi:MAG: transposase [Burkholderia sp.]
MCEAASYAAPIGKTPGRRVASRRAGLSVMSAVTNRGQVCWKVFESAMSADILLDLLKRLIKDMRSKKVFLILDNLKVLDAKPVSAWLAEHFDEIEVFYLPSYSPELNPDEMLKTALKAKVTKQALEWTKGHLKKSGHQPLTSSPEITHNVSLAMSCTNQFVMQLESNSRISDQYTTTPVNSLAKATFSG